MNKKISEKLICEVRVKPDSIFLDKRGEIANIISKNKTFLHWNIGPNKIDFSSDSNKNIKAQFSYLGFSVSSESPNNRSYLVGNLKTIIEDTWEYWSHNSIKRTGARSTYVIEVDSFKEIFGLIKEKFLIPGGLNICSSSLYDIGISLNFSDGEKFSHVSIGPMEEKQIKENFPDQTKKDLPKNALFIDIDSFKNSLSPNIQKKDLISLIKELFIENEKIKENIIKKIWEK